jgi:transcriptional regulator with XRE-family HTH domain
MKPTQKKIADALKVSQPFISQVLAGKKSVPWPIAEKLANLFPIKDVGAWKRATPEELKQAFAQLPASNSNEEAA